MFFKRTIWQHWRDYHAVVTNLSCKVTDVRIVLSIQKYAQQMESLCHWRLALPTLQNAGEEEEDHSFTSFSWVEVGLLQATIQLSIRVEFLDSTLINWNFPCTFCWKWLSFRSNSINKGYGNLCQGCDGMDRNSASSSGTRQGLTLDNPLLPLRALTQEPDCTHSNLSSKLIYYGALKDWC